MTAEPSRRRGRRRTADCGAAATVDGRRPSVGACCSAVYGSPLAELLVGDSLHPGGLAEYAQPARGGPTAPGSRLLDIGCGLGASARLAADRFGLRVERRRCQRCR